MAAKKSAQKKRLAKLKPGKAKKIVAKAPSPKKKARAQRARQKSPKKSGAASRKATLPTFQLVAGGQTWRLGVLFAQSYDEKTIRRWPDAYADVAAFNRAHGTHLSLVRMPVLDRFIEAGVIGGMAAISLSPIVLPGILAHEASGKPIGARIVCPGTPAVVVTKTGAFAGQKDVAMWLPDPRPGEIVRTPERIEIVAEPSRYIAVARPATEAGWYALDGKTGVPCGDRADEEPAPNVIHLEGVQESLEVVGGPGTPVIVPERERRTRYLIANAPRACYVGPLVRDSSRSRIAHGYGLGSVSALVEIDDADAKRVTLAKPPG